MPTLPFRLLVVAFWLGMMGWLFERELLPRLILGPPPGYRDVVATVPSDDEEVPPAEWEVMGRSGPLGASERIGTATTSVTRRRNGITVLSGTVDLDRLPLMGLLESADQPMSLSAKTHFYIGPAGRLRHFRIEAAIEGIEAPLHVLGRVQDKQLHVTLQLNGSSHEQTLAYDPSGLVMNSFSPVGHMPNLRVGQTWNIPVVNPLTGQVNLVRAKVTGRDLISWGNDDAQSVFVVTQTTGIAGTEVRTWVRRDGLVLRQEVPLLFSTMTFERAPEPEEAETR